MRLIIFLKMKHSGFNLLKKQLTKIKAVSFLENSVNLVLEKCSI